MRNLLRIVVLALLLGCGGWAWGDALTADQLYFDPGSLMDDYYTRVSLPDLATANSYTWHSGADRIVSANILPLLKWNVYGSDYVYSQSDYFLTPLVDYSADLDAGTGDLRASFSAPGLYHVRLGYASGASDIVAVFAETDLKEKTNPDKTGKVMKLDTVPAADLIVVENSDSTMDKSAAVWEKAGRKVVRVNTRDEAVQAIKNRSVELGRKIHVEIDGHGASGNISTGAGKNDIADKQIDLSSVEDFESKVKAYASQVTFQGCSVGSGADGKRFLDLLATSLGSGNSGAWDKPVTVIDSSGFSVPTDAKWVTGTPIPLPAAASMGLIGLAALGWFNAGCARRRRIAA